jgi:uncharacterized LabA/DUF88 family protein
MNENPDTKIIAYIDGANLDKGIYRLGWNLDYERFLIWLRDRHGVSKALFFSGRIGNMSCFYDELEKYGYILVLRETVRVYGGKIKGNCDTEMVLRVAIDAFEGSLDQAVIISGDGDFACLVDFLKDRSKIKTVIAPHSDRCSILLKRTGIPITFLSELKEALQKEKAPNEDGTSPGSLSL